MESKGPKLEVFGESRSIYDLGFRYKINEGVTVFQSGVVGFSLPPHYSYTVIETGEQFSGNTGDAKEDYMLWKALERMKASKSAKKERNLLSKECSSDPKENPWLTKQTLNTETKVSQALPNTATALPPLEELIGKVPSRQEEPMDIP